MATGLDGIREGINPGEAIDINVYELTEAEREAKDIVTLPANLKKALGSLEQDNVIRQALGEHVFNNIMRLGNLE